ncbi:MAG: hypothetical protein Q8R20_02325 [Nanoarchaeota archaeon]|nr:hypothetical protein [Nanoarchaeota archaeon]
MSRFQKKIFTELGIAIGILAVLGGGIMFFSSNMKTFAARLHETKRELKLRSSSISRVTELQRIEKQFGGPYLNVLYNFVPKKDELINFSREAQALASSEGLEFGFSFLGENPASNDALGSVRFAVNVSGKSEANIRNMLKKLQEFRFFVKIEDFSISNAEEGAKGTIRGQVFFRS